MTLVAVGVLRSLRGQSAIPSGGYPRFLLGVRYLYGRKEITANQVDSLRVISMSHPDRAATRAREFRRPSDEALRVAAQAAKRARDRATPVRIRFIERAQPEDPPPPLARVIRGGLGGEVRLKLLLALLWLGAGGQHDVQFPAHTYAALLGLPDRYTNGARRVNDALNWLRDHAFITIERVAGHEPKITLLSELGNGRPYVVPGQAPKDPETDKATLDNIYVRLPVAFWTKGWAATLSGPATAMLLVLLLLERTRPGCSCSAGPTGMSWAYG